MKYKLMHAHVSAKLANLAGRLPGDNLLQHRELQLVACSHGSRLVLPVYWIATHANVAVTRWDDRVVPDYVTSLATRIMSTREWSSLGRFPGGLFLWLHMFLLCVVVDRERSIICLFLTHTWLEKLKTKEKTQGQSFGLCAYSNKTRQKCHVPSCMCAGVSYPCSAAQVNGPILGKAAVRSQNRAAGSQKPG